MKQGKTICIFSVNYLPNLGGVERYTYNLAKTLHLHGNEIIIVTSNVFNLKNYEIVDGITIFRVPCFNVLNGRFPILKYNKIFKKIVKDLKKRKIDLMVINTRYYIHSLYGVRFAYKNDIRMILIDHSTGHLTINNPILDFFGRGFEHLLTAIIKHYCKSFYGVSKACNEWLKHFNINANEVLYNAVDINEINGILKNGNFSYREKWSIKDSDLFITYAGRLVKEKGVLNLINSIKVLNKNHENIHLFIAGSGELETEVRESCNDNIHFLDRLDFKEVISLLKETDIFCLPTEYPEGFPTSILEAISCKCYIVTTSQGGAKELILDDSYGSILENNSVNLLCSTIVKIMDNDQRKSAVEKSYLALIQNFTWEKTAKCVEKIANNRK